MLAYWRISELDMVHWDSRKWTIGL
jgi:hypothetical protein